MKIAFTTSGTDLAAPMDPRFGRAAHFLIFDTGTDDFFLIGNATAAAAQGMAKQIESKAAVSGAVVLGRIRYDRGVTEAQKQAKAVIETRALCSGDIEDIWNNLQHHIGKETST